MSSLRNVVRRREHRERGQLHNRQGLGLLEKKKDYKLRAKDYHSKQNRLRALKEKASFRNPDEFYFGMIRGKKGVASDGVPERTPEEQKLAVSRDAAYVHVKASADEAKVKKLKSQLHFLNASTAGASSSSTSKHTIFVDDAEEQQTFDACEYFDVPKELLSRAFNRPRNEDIEKIIPQSSGTGSIAQAERKKAAEYRELNGHLKRSKVSPFLPPSVDQLSPSRSQSPTLQTSTPTTKTTHPPTLLFLPLIPPPSALKNSH